MQDFWQKTIAGATEVRRTLHQHPELTWQEESTARLIRNKLTDLDIPWRSCARTGTVATINPDGQSPAIALRADIDALPVDESSGVDWQSNCEGRMHACGHDGHAATLLAAAAWLKQHEPALPCQLKLLFQPAEEGGHGAKAMIDDGALDGVGSIFGWHNWPWLEFGKLACPEGIVMAGNGTFDITLTAAGGHASQPDTTGDTILAASAVTLALQQIVSRRLPPQTAAVVSVASIDGVSAPTVIPGRVTLAGSIRVPNAKVRKRINELIPQIASSTAQAYGVGAHTQLHPRYEATINHPESAQQVRAAWTQLYGGAALAPEFLVPAMASEDFSYYLQEVPGAYALIGAADGQAVHDSPLHSSTYDFNDALIPAVARLFTQLAGAPLP